MQNFYTRVPSLGIMVLLVCGWTSSMAAEVRAGLVFEVFEGQGFAGQSFGLTASEMSPMRGIPLQHVRSLKVYSQILLAFRVDGSFSSDGGGVLVVQGPLDVGNLSFTPRRSCTGTPSGCVVTPAGNWDDRIRYVATWNGSRPSGDNNSVVTVIGAPPASGPHLSDAECRTSASPPRRQAVYKISRTNDRNTCLSYDPDGDREEVPINNCHTEQKKLFTLIPAPNGCWLIRNGDTRTPPPGGRCLDNVESWSGELKAMGCDWSAHQLWKLYERAGGFDLINQNSGRCLDRRSDGGDPYVHICNASEWQNWTLEYVRDN